MRWRTVGKDRHFLINSGKSQMAVTKKYDLAVKTGSYQDNTGATKNRYQNIGAVMQGDNGPFLLLDPLINLAAVPREAGKDRVLVSCFDPKQDGQQQAPRQAAPQRQQPMPEEDVPFN